MKGIKEDLRRHDAEDSSYASVERRMDERERKLKCLNIIGEYSPSSCLREEDFVDIYGEAEIARDIQSRDKKKKLFREEAEKAGTTETQEQVKLKSEAMERIIAWHGEMSEWFGPWVHITKTTEYDDIMHGADLILVFDIPEEDAREIGIDEKIQRTALVLDATSSQNVDTVTHKIRQSIEKVEKGGVKIKHYASDADPEHKGPLSDVIPAVIGVDANNTNQMIDDVYQNLVLGSKKEMSPGEKEHYREVKKGISEYPAQMVFLKELSIQLGMYADILTKPEVVSRVLSLKKVIDYLYQEKIEMGFSEKWMKDDHTLSRITEIAQESLVAA